MGMKIKEWLQSLSFRTGVIVLENGGFQEKA